MHTSGLISRKRKLETDEDISQINNDPLAKGFLESFNERRKRVRPNDDIRPTSTFTSLWRTDSNKKLPKIIDFSSETYVCFKENCNSRSFTWSDLCLHVQEQHSEKCASCGELLICQAQIDHHRKIHESPKGFVCGEDGCEKIFSTRLYNREGIFEPELQTFANFYFTRRIKFQYLFCKFHGGGHLVSI
ncbi:C2H2-type zinc finger transcription factor [Phycomyces blakesleeanus NRRL 1555(-)]|uniref:C2H2-type zinc finger transcription factor n=1 Tax=Phycomyces blakesleeanus (strain ATCC 8743b / DSM 1359 / FGSC 10004 / NBRC 33097 / NRRL 1555) TaxID=763407 RepID=A0A163DM32_PHYB8|nr:C2H2-type zinc finger transcription factor [Phycomyces blakesleeanus NRRL 1555(-)]OAD72260.1 C2H2-type zinc finger transcription factor [Phycomyces blakesleeanus NRRL 1555(-)]|eukprot:XP_018290300.1 C2H2-type zinc finger transcription factor [Phycomyces blakesleeanus NRRL 1555(-)]